MSTPVLDLIDETTAVTGVGYGSNRRPTMSTSPTVRQMLDWLTEAEQDCLNRLTDVRQSSTTITTVAGTATYSTITDNMPRRWSKARIGATGERKVDLPYMEFDAMQARYPDWDSGNTSGKPAWFTVTPAGRVGYYPTPDGTYSVEHFYTLGLQKLALPGDVVWFLASEEPPSSGDDSILSASDFRHSYVDRARRLWAQGDGSTELRGYDITLGIIGTNEVETTATLTLDASNSATIVMSSYLVLGVTSVTLAAAGAEGLAINVGISETFSGGTPTFDVARATSMLPDEWALRLAPHWAAAKWFERVGDGEQADRHRALFLAEQQKFIRQYNMTGATKIRLFGH